MDLPYISTNTSSHWTILDLCMIISCYSLSNLIHIDYVRDNNHYIGTFCHCRDIMMLAMKRQTTKPQIDPLTGEVQPTEPQPEPAQVEFAADPNVEQEEVRPLCLVCCYSNILIVQHC